MCNELAVNWKRRIMMRKELAFEGRRLVIDNVYSKDEFFDFLEMKPKLRFTRRELERVGESENDFLMKIGIKKVIDELGIEYVNITEEVLAKRIVSKEIVKKQVEKNFPPVLREELYIFLPIRLYKLRNGTFISLARVC